MGQQQPRFANGWRRLKAIERWLSRLTSAALLWPPYAIGHAIIFSSCGYSYFFFFLSFFLSFFPSILSSRRLDVYHTSTHDVA